MLKQRIAGGELLFGTFAFLPSPDVIEILALAGMDFAIVDLEHSPKDWGTIQHMIRAANIHKLPVLIRVSENSEKLILQCLEIGADGLVVPFVQSRNDVDAAIGAMYYPPRGRRGTCTLTPITGYGAKRSRFLEHCRAQDDRLVLIAQVEDRAGVDHIDEILAADPGVDVVLMGRSDLASSFGLPGQVEDPRVLEATSRVLQAARRRRPGPAVAMGIYSAEESARWQEEGCTIFFAPSDGLLMFNAVQSWLGAVRGRGPRPGEVQSI